VSGSGTNTLQFEYTVGAGQNAADLAITGFNLGGVKDKAGNTVNLAGAPRMPAGTLAIGAAAMPATPTDTTAPRMQWVAANGPGVTNGTGTVGVGDTVRLSVNFSEAVNVTGSPSLTLNSNGSAKYVSGSGTNTLQFDYTVGAGENARDLEISGFNLGGVKDRAGNTVNLAGAPHQPAGTLAVRTTAPMAAMSANLAAPSASVTDLAASAAATSDAGSSTGGSNTGGSNLNAWSGFGNQARGVGSAFSNNTTLGYAGNLTGAGGNPPAVDGSFVSRMALLGQYAASSFVGAGPGLVGAPMQSAAAEFAQTLAKPRG
jgi:hypothetical protein